MDGWMVGWMDGQMDGWIDRWMAGWTVLTWVDVFLCLLLCCQEDLVFRYTTSEVTVQPSPCLSYRIPRDFVDLSTGEDAYKLIDFLKLVRVEPHNQPSVSHVSVTGPHWSSL